MIILPPKHGRLVLSVVMGVYNGENAIADTIDSILSQTFTDFEFIIINDGSTDATSGILERYAAKDRRIRVIGQGNTGLTRALIRGCRKAKGTFIARQDVGDISMPVRFEKQICLLESDDRLVFSSCWAKMLGPGEEILDEIKRAGDPEKATKELLYAKQGPPCHGTVIFSKEAYGKAGGYREQFYYGQDSDLWLRMARTGLIGYVQEFLYEFKFTHRDISFLRRDLQKKFGEIGQACHKARMAGKSENFYLTKALETKKRIIEKPEEGRQKLYKMNYFIGSCLLKRKDQRALGYLKKALRENPFYWRTWMRLIQIVIINAIKLWLDRIRKI
ncbi:MAG: glycosyltransferase [Candidatus Omnitrophota bacterium]|nr:glycosyltransferase [Candidatus Omnitrophota bacterium]